MVNESKTFHNWTNIAFYLWSLLHLTILTCDGNLVNDRFNVRLQFGHSPAPLNLKVPFCRYRLNGAFCQSNPDYLSGRKFTGTPSPKSTCINLKDLVGVSINHVTDFGRPRALLAASLPKS